MSVEVKIEIKIRGIVYYVTCDNNEKDINRLKILSDKLNKRVEEKYSIITKRQNNPQSNSNITAIVLTALQLQDEILDIEDENSRELKKRDLIIDDLKKILKNTQLSLEDIIKKLEILVKNNL